MRAGSSRWLLKEMAPTHLPPGDFLFRPDLSSGKQQAKKRGQHKRPGEELTPNDTVRCKSRTGSSGKSPIKRARFKSVLLFTIRYKYFRISVHSDKRWNVAGTTTYLNEWMDWREILAVSFFVCFFFFYPQGRIIFIIRVFHFLSVAHISYTTT